MEDIKQSFGQKKF